MYYDTKYGARARTVRSDFNPGGTVWEVNKVWFKLASDRAKTLTQEQKWAWQKAYLSVCDVWRDLFMGKQIEAWNNSPQNNLTWPQVGVKKLDSMSFKINNSEHPKVYVNWDVIDLEIVRWNVSNYMYWSSEDPGFEPTGENVPRVSQHGGVSFTVVPGQTTYFWGGVRYMNGDCAFVFVGEVGGT
jgi:hypothetical protein